MYVGFLDYISSKMKASALRFIVETTTEIIPQIIPSINITQLTTENTPQLSPSVTNTPLTTDIHDTLESITSEMMKESGEESFIISFNFGLGIVFIILLAMVVLRCVFARRQRIRRAVSVLLSDEEAFGRSFSSEIRSTDTINSCGYGTSHSVDVDCSRALIPPVTSTTIEPSVYVSCQSPVSIDSNPRNLPSEMSSSKCKKQTDL